MSGLVFGLKLSNGVEMITLALTIFVNKSKYRKKFEIVSLLTTLLYKISYDSIT